MGDIANPSTGSGSVNRFACHVCGATGNIALYRANPIGRPGVWTCEAHWSRVPCAIDGCGRTRDRARCGSDWICTEHWRRFVPPRSRPRQIYNRNWRRYEALRKVGSDDPAHQAALSRARRRVDAYWNLIVTRARRLATEGVIDEAEINRFMGWDQ